MYHNEIKNRNKALQSAVLKKTQEVEDLRSELINRLLRAVEFRDIETGYHISRMEKYAFIMAKAFEFSDEYATDFALASKMHDIGKIGIPDDVLLKQGKLNEKEWDLMKGHTNKGAQILKDSASQVIILAEEIALTHHERWDGNGYPNGLKGEEIPLTGRITALIDVFDALLSKRPYKAPWTKEEVVEYIKSQSGAQFDPSVVMAFEKNLTALFDVAAEMMD